MLYTLSLSAETTPVPCGWQLLIGKQGTGEPVNVDFELTDNVYAKARGPLQIRPAARPGSFAAARLRASRRIRGSLVKALFGALQAVLKDTANVSLWLGANVMLEYSLDEARYPRRKPSRAARHMPEHRVSLMRAAMLPC